MLLKHIRIGILVQDNFTDKIGFIKDIDETPKGTPIFLIRFTNGMERLLLPDEFDIPE